MADNLTLLMAVCLMTMMVVLLEITMARLIEDLWVDHWGYEKAPLLAYQKGLSIACHLASTMES